VSAGTWPAADERLVRSYRRLLLAYSGRYRRLYGPDMITTMLEMAGPTRSRPSVGEACHLIASGLRQRFRLPSGRPFVAMTAVLVTIVLGVFGAAAGSWLGESTSADLPSRTQAVKLVNAAVTDPRYVSVRRFHMSGRTDSLDFSAAPSAQQPNWTVEKARAGLTAAGWTITEFTIRPSEGGFACTGDTTSDQSCVFESRYATLIAERDGLLLRGRASDFLTDKSGHAWVGGINGQLFAEHDAAYLPLVVAGGLLGALFGWLLTAAFAYRVRALPPRSGRLVAAFTGLAVTAAAPAVWALIVNAVMVGEHLTSNVPVYSLHAALRPGSHLDGVAPWLIPGCTIVAAAAAAIAVGILVLGAGREEPPGATQRT
jgi:hypothetical protein